MRISVTRSGGFAGQVRTYVLETAGRPDADQLHALAREALAAPARTDPVVPDGFTYRLTLGPRTLHCADPHLTEAQRTLIHVLSTEGTLQAPR
jgi:hypothetical protein